MMTNEEILELAKTCGFDEFQKRKYDGERDYGTYWECWEQELLKFTQEIYSKGYEDGVNMMRNVEDYND
jgi:hypothetical protein